MCNTCDEKLNRKSKKEKRLRKRKHKCLENDEKTKELPKCPKPKRPPPKAVKCLTKIEKIMLRIQPPIADRERYLHPAHVNCFLEESERVYIKKPKCKPCPSERRKICLEDKKSKKKHNVNVEGEKDKYKKTEKGRENDAEFSATKQTGEENTEVERNEDKFERGKAEGQKIKKNQKKKNKEKRNRKENIAEDSDSEMSICSNDSEVCLTGIGLTEENKKMIEENRRKVHPPSDNEENSTESSKNKQDIPL